MPTLPTNSWPHITSLPGSIVMGYPRGGTRTKLSCKVDGRRCKRTTDRPLPEPLANHEARDGKDRAVILVFGATGPRDPHLLQMPATGLRVQPALELIARHPAPIRLRDLEPLALAGRRIAARSEDRGEIIPRCLACRDDRDCCVHRPSVTPSCDNAKGQAIGFTRSADQTSSSDTRVTPVNPTSPRAACSVSR